MCSMLRKDHELYLQDNRYDKPKEYFKFVNSIFSSQRDVSTVLDIGCATGEFIYYLLREHPHLSATGIDLSSELIERAKEKVVGAHFTVGNVLKRETLGQEKYDAVFLLGTLTSINAVEETLSNTIDLCRQGGKLYILSLFNDYPMDVFVNIRMKNPGSADRDLGFGPNVYSKITMNELAAKDKRVAGVEFHDFSMPIDIAKGSNPIRTWTFQAHDGERMITSGCCLLYTFKLCVISL